jgi:hypothetical protein
MIYLEVLAIRMVRIAVSIATIMVVGLLPSISCASERAPAPAVTSPNPIPMPSPPQGSSETFKLTGWKVVADGCHYLEVEYSVASSSEARNLYLVDVNGLELDSDRITEFEADSVTRDQAGLRILHFRSKLCLFKDPLHNLYKNLYGVQYKLMVDTLDGKTIFTKDFSFSGPNVVVVKGVSVSPGDYGTTDWSITLKNQGDLPAYIECARSELRLDGRSTTAYAALPGYTAWINPNEEYVWKSWVSLQWFTPPMSPGQKTFDLILRDKDGNVISSYSSSIVITQ